MLVFLGVLALAGALMVAVVAASGSGSEDQWFPRTTGEAEAVARALGEGERSGPRTIGGMEFEEVGREHGVVFFQRGETMASPYGYVWSPQGDPARILDGVEPSGDPVDHSFEHLRGAFYSWQGRR
ncbi:hypothetical protein [Nonomuraea sp. NPDC050643]|uniref:hypothetical protein n=1 Tax=Nonomuraea sp. NPDC050643 TaxID=3155660 RepID=UPI0033FAF653